MLVRNNSVTTSRKQSTSGKPLAAEPATIRGVLEESAVDVCRVHLIPKIEYKAGVLFVAVTFLSLLSDRFMTTTALTSFRLADRYSFLNQVFVKWGWLWTLITCGPFIYLTSAVFTCNNQLQIVRHLSRLALGTFMWYFWVNIIFYRVEKSTRQCTVFELATERECLAGGGLWYSFDISGHCFLLIYSLLIMSEEGRAYENWSRLRSLIISNIESPPSGSNSGETELALEAYEANTWKIKIWLVVFVSGLSMIWYWQLLLTAVYYHTVAHKVMGSLVAIFSWFITYRYIFTLSWTAPLPGVGRFRYLR